MSACECSEKSNDTCCFNCKFFEERTSFCRYNPPVPIVTQSKNGSPYVSSVYSKVNYPQIDWCQKFEPL